MSYEGFTGLIYSTIGGAALGGIVTHYHTGNWIYAFIGTVAGAFLGAAVGFGVGIALSWEYNDEWWWLPRWLKSRHIGLFYTYFFTALTLNIYILNENKLKK